MAGLDFRGLPVKLYSPFVRWSAPAITAGAGLKRMPTLRCFYILNPNAAHA